jgi:anhydro-N-acetylmuramic acid kinase
MRGVGIMSGTSLDGVDAALVDITTKDGELSVQLLHKTTIAYSKKMYQKIKQACDPIEVTVLPINGTLADLIAFDTGPGNMIIDELMQQLFELPYDADGKIAQSGTIIPKLQQQLRNHSYLTKVPPKSTGRELFGKAFTEQLLVEFANEAPADLVATVTDFTAYSIAESYKQFVFPKIGSEPIEVILTGGGANNPTLRKMIRNYLPTEITLTTEKLGWTNDAKEAIAFALLGYETLHGHTNNAPAATGANRSVILGKIIPKPYYDPQ